MMVIPKAASDWDMGVIEGMQNSGNAFTADKLMKSLINIERSSQLIMTTTYFDYNWLVENTCSPMRA